MSNVRGLCAICFHLTFLPMFSDSVVSRWLVPLHHWPVVPSLGKLCKRYTGFLPCKIRPVQLSYASHAMHEWMSIYSIRLGPCQETHYFATHYILWLVVSWYFIEFLPSKIFKFLSRPLSWSTYHTKAARWSNLGPPATPPLSRNASKFRRWKEETFHKVYMTLGLETSN